MNRKRRVFPRIDPFSRTYKEELKKIREFREQFADIPGINPDLGIENETLRLFRDVMKRMREMGMITEENENRNNEK